MAYSLAFSSSKTKETFEIVTNRLKKGRQFDAEVAEFLRERALIEERYAQELFRLSKRTIQIEKDQLGGFFETWEVVLNCTTEAAEAHKALSAEISDKFERPLRQRADVDAGWAKQKQHESDLSRLNKDYEDEIRTIKKSTDSVGKINFFKKSRPKDLSSNQDTAAALQKARDHHAAKVGPVLERIQSLDESRIMFLKDILEKLASSLSVYSKKLVDIPDKLLAVVLSLDVQTEIETFCAKKSNNNESNVNSNSGSATPSRNASVVAPHADTSAAPAGDFTIPAPNIDSEGFSIPLPSASKWPEPVRDSDDEGETEASDGTVPSKLKISIKTSAIEDNPDAALKTMQSLAATLQKMPTVRRSIFPVSPGISDAGSVDPSVPVLVPLTVQTSAPVVASTSTVPTIGTQILQPISVNNPIGDTALKPIVFTRLHTLITETISAIISDSSIEKLMITGEIAISLEDSKDKVMPDIKLSLSNYGALEKVVLNPTFVTAPDKERPSDVTLHAAALATAPGASATVIKYKVEVEQADLDLYTPLMVTALWKLEGNHVTVIIGYQYNDDIRERVSLKDVSFLVTLENSGEVTSVQNKPATGLWNAEKKALLWRVGDIEPPGFPGSSAGDMSPAASSLAEPQRLIARFEIPNGAESVVGLVTVRFAGQNLLSGVDVETAFGEPAVIASSTKSLVTGKYLVRK